MAESVPFVRHLSEVTRHMAWADASVWNAVLAAPRAAADAKLVDTLHHIHLVQHIFQQAWTGAPFEVRQRSEFASPGELLPWGREAHRGIGEYMAALTSEAADRTFRMPWASQYEELSKRPAGAHTLGESVLQVVLHSQHHRGQVCARLRELGGEPPTVDLIVWLWAGRPEPHWGE